MTTRRSVRRVLPLVLAALTLGFGLPATAPGAQAWDHGDAVVATDHIRLPPAKAVTPRGHAESKDRRQPPGPVPTDAEERRAAARERSAQQRPSVGGSRSSAPLAAPAGQFHFEGLDQGSTGVRPPDTHGAVGLNHFVEVTNGRGIGVFDKSNGANVLTVSFASFFGYTTTLIFDPRAVYDKKWNRWVIVAEALPLPSNPSIQYVFVAVSTTSDPTGAYFRYRFDLPEGTDFFDFPQLGLDQDAVIVTGNVFNASLTAYHRTRVLAFAKADIYNGRATTFPYFNLGAVGSVAPPIVEDNNANAFLLTASPSGALRLFRATGLGRSNASITAPVNVPVPAFALPPNARQPGSPDLLDTSDARFQNASTQIGNQLLNIHTIAVSSRPRPKWYQINTSTNALTASGFVFETGDSDDFNPAVAGSPVGGTAANPIGSMFFTWSSTDVVGSGLHHAAIKGSGRFATDSTTVTGGSTFALAGGPYNASPATVERWGDYSAVTIDPVAVSGCPVGQRAWLVNERHVSTSMWGSRIGRLGYC